MRRSLLLGLASFLIASPVTLAAQSATTGALSGKVLGPGGDGLAAARVTLRSTQITRILVTDAKGEFLAGFLNPGTWKVTVDLPGYETSIHTVSIATNATTPIRIRMAGSAGATVAVVAAASQVAIDTTTTAQSVNFTEEIFSTLPNSRNMSDLAFLAPGVAYGGNMSEGQGLGYSMSGASGAENSFIIDGMSTNDFRYGGQGSELVPDFIESVEVQTSGFKPEFSALGGVLNAVIKSGTNEFKGTGWVTYEPGSLAGKTKSNAITVETAAPTRYDVGAGVGGAIIKDKLFYYVGLDANYLRTTPDLNLSGLQSGTDTVDSLQTVVKLNYYITADQQLTASYFETNKNYNNPNAYPGYNALPGGGAFGDANLSNKQLYDMSNLSLVYDWTILPNLFLSLKMGVSHILNTYTPQDTTDLNILDYNYITTGPNAGQGFMRGGYGSYDDETGNTKQYKADLTWVLGDHSLKFGVASLTNRYWRQDFASGPAGQNLTWTIDSLTDLYSIYYGNIGGDSVFAKYTGVYAQDSWEVTKGFKVFYGARAETQQQFGSNGTRFLNFNQLGKQIQPRVGFTWDLNNDAKSKLDGSYAIYYEQIPQRIGIREFGNQAYLLHFYNLTVPSSTGLGTYQEYDPVALTDYGTPFNYVPVMNGLKLPRRSEYSLGYEQVLPHGLVASISGMYRHLDHVVEDGAIYMPGGLTGDGTGYDNNMAAGFPIETAILWNPGPGPVSWTAKPGDLGPTGLPIGGQTVNVQNTGYPTLYNTYIGWTVGLKQQLEHLFWSATYTWSHFYGNYEGVIAPDYGGGGQPDGNITASWDSQYYGGTGNLSQDRPNAFKFYGSYAIPFQNCTWTIGAQWTWVNGTPISLFDDGSSSVGLAPGTLSGLDGGQGVLSNPLDPGAYGNSDPDHFLLGNHGRSPDQSKVDVHTELAYRVSWGKITPSVDIFNFFNKRSATSVWQYATHQSSGTPDPNYGLPQSWIPERMLQFNLRFTF